MDARIKELIEEAENRKLMQQHRNGEYNDHDQQVWSYRYARRCTDVNEPQIQERGE